LVIKKNGGNMKLGEGESHTSKRKSGNRPTTCKMREQRLSKNDRKQREPKIGRGGDADREVLGTHRSQKKEGGTILCKTQPRDHPGRGCSGEKNVNG